MVKQRFITLIKIFTLFITFSCGKEEFTTKATKEQFASSGVTKETLTSCSNFSLIKPKVDFLFVWDNSGSINLLTDDNRKALSKTIQYISNRFNYHIMMSPLINMLDSAGKPIHYLLLDNPDDITDADAKKYIQATDLNNFSNLSQTFKPDPLTGSQEKGFLRAQTLLKNNINNGIFRTDAYTMVVLVSNEDDDWEQVGPYFNPKLEEQDFNNNLAEFVSIRATLKSEMFRFMSIVPHTDGCRPGYRKGHRYMRMSKELYSSQNSGFTLPSDQIMRSTPDSYDICTMNFDSIFDGINQSIQDVIVKHVYQYWPIKIASLTGFDPTKLEVRKNNGQILSENDPNGFKYVGYQTNQNLRVLPSIGEPYTGYLIQLFGAGQVTYPECLVITTQTPPDYYGYIVLAANPNLDTINLKVNGNKINPVDANKTEGWEFIGYQSNINVKVKSPSENNVPGTPAEVKSGYVLKLYGSAIYSNNSSIDIYYKPNAM